MLIPYIGITDFGARKEIERMLNEFKEHVPLGSNRRLRAGAILHWQKLYNDKANWLKIYPAKEAIAYILASRETYNCLQYVGDSRKYGFWKDLLRAILYGGVGINAVQLDMTWPDPNDIARGVETAGKEIEIILQLNSDVLRDPQRGIVHKLKNYRGVIHRVFLNKDPHNLASLIEAIEEGLPGIGVVITGGLAPEGVSRLEPLIKKHPGLSIDAQGVYYPNTGVCPISWDVTREYFVTAFKLYEDLDENTSKSVDFDAVPLP